MGKSNRGVEDESALQFATQENRCVITINRKDFMCLHHDSPAHAGIIVCTQNRDYAAFATRIDAAIRPSAILADQLLHVVRD